jgi:zinc protease
MKQFHAQFYGASNGELVVAGQFDQELAKAAADLAGGGAPAYQRIANSTKKLEPVNLKIETPDKQNASFEAGIRFRMSDEDPITLPWCSPLYVRRVAGSRVPNRIRNVEGLSCGVSSRLLRLAGDLLFQLGDQRPQNTPKVE